MIKYEPFVRLKDSLWILEIKFYDFRSKVVKIDETNLTTFFWGGIGESCGGEVPVPGGVMIFCLK